MEHICRAWFHRLHVCFIIFLPILVNERYRCQFPQITPEGLDDSLTHGAVRFNHIQGVSRTEPHFYRQDLRSVYAPLLQLPPIYDPSIFRFRMFVQMHLLSSSLKF